MLSFPTCSFMISSQWLLPMVQECCSASIYHVCFPASREEEMEGRSCSQLSIQLSGNIMNYSFVSAPSHGDYLAAVEFGIFFYLTRGHFSIAF